MAGLLGTLLLGAPGSEQMPLASMPDQNMSVGPEPLPPAAAPVAGAPVESMTPEQQLAYVGSSGARPLADAAFVASQGQQKSQAILAGGAGKVRRELAAGRESIINAEGAEMAAAGMEADAVAPVFEEYRKASYEREKDFAVRHAEAKMQAKNAYDDYIRAANDFSRTSVYNWWSNASTAASILGVISQTLNGALQGMTGNLGGPSPLDKIIEQDLQRQKMDLERKGQAAYTAGNMYARIRAQVNDDMQAEMMFRQVAWESTKSRAQALIAGMPEIQKAKAQANAMKITAAADMKVAETMATVQNGLNEAALRESFQNSNMGITIATHMETVDAQNAARRGQNMHLALGRLSPESALLDPGIRDKVWARVSAGENAVRAIDKLNETLGLPKTTQIVDGQIVVTEKAKESPGIFKKWMKQEQVQNQLLAIYKEMQNFGASLTDGEKRIAMAAMGGTTTGPKGWILDALGVNTYEAMQERLRDLRQEVIEKANTDVVNSGKGVRIVDGPLLWRPRNG